MIALRIMIKEFELSHGQLHDLLVREVGACFGDAMALPRAWGRLCVISFVTASLPPTGR